MINPKFVNCKTCNLTSLFNCRHNYALYVLSSLIVNSETLDIVLPAERIQNSYHTPVVIIGGYSSMHVQKHLSVPVQRFEASAGIPYGSQNQGVRC